VAFGSEHSEKEIKRTKYFSRLELDLSTYAIFDNEFNSQHAILLFDEFMTLAKEIAEEGDRP